MFTGIIEELGRVKSVTKGNEWCRLTIAAGTILQDVKMGDSIAVNGVCLTVTAFAQNYFTADAMPETMARTSLSQLAPGSPVNLERAMAAGGRFGGHFVSGHVDGTGRIAAKNSQGNAVFFHISTDTELLNGMVPKGSITIDGISLTIVDLDETGFSVSVIPHTLAQTVLQYKGVNDVVNLECDMIGKYVWRFLERQAAGKNTDVKLTKQFLAEHGFA